MKLQVPENIEAMAAYEPGKPIEELERQLGIAGAVKLASNENPLGPSPKAIEAAHAALAGGNRYPDAAGFRLRGALAAHHGVSPDEILLGAGSNEIIELLVRVFCRPGTDEALTPRYSFVMYGVSCQAQGVTLRESEVTPELGCDVDALAAAITARTRLIFLANPNNPTGSHVRRADFERLLGRLPPHVILVVDEAYFEFAQGTPEYPVAERYRTPERLIVTLRTFSKAYGLAALRAGYALADARIVSYLNRVRMPFNVSSAAQQAAIAALGDAEHVRRTVENNRAGLAQLHAGLTELPVHAYPSLANFILIDLRRDAAPVYEALLRRGVIVRPMRPYGLGRHLRVSVGTTAENERFLGALREALG